MFSAKTFRSKKAQEAYDKTIAGRYQKLIKKNHFLYFGLPFMLLIALGSVYLKQFVAVKWEKYDEKYQQLGEEEMLNLIENKREVNKKDDYYRLQGMLEEHTKQVGNDYDIVRVQRKKEDEPVWWSGGKL